MIVIYTRAYNAEVTLRRTMDSILNQTYTDFRYVLLNNGSIDSTLDIMTEYAQKDKRVIILSRPINQKSFQSCMSILTFIKHNFGPEDYFCNIDADDVYQPDFFEKMLSFAQKNQLDTVFCGYNMLDRDTDAVIDCKKLESDLVLTNAELPQYFMTFRRYTTDMWAKFFKVSLLQYYLDDDRFEKLKGLNHSQQNFIFDALKNSAKVGFLSEALMDYYVSGTVQKNTRLGENVSVLQARDIFRIMQDFLSHFKTTEELDLRNTSYIYAIYFGYIKDLIEVLKLSNYFSLSNKINTFFDIFSHHITQEMLVLKADDSFYSLRPESKESLCQGTVDYIVSQKGWETYKVKVEMLVSNMQNCGVPVVLAEEKC